MDFSVFGAVAQGFSGLFSDPICFVYMILGVFIGIVFGAIPGLTAALGVSLVLPFTFAMTTSQGLTTLISIYVGGIAGGLVSAILLNIPGSPAAIVTCFDGSPMARRGRPNDALTLGTFSSLLGGTFSAICLIFLASQIARFSLKFGSWEYFAMGIMGLSVVVGLCSEDIVKGLISAVLGLLIAMVGIDPVSSAQRFTFGAWQLGAGFANLPTLMGLFAFAEILAQLRNLDKQGVVLNVDKIRLFPHKDHLKGQTKNFAISSIIGTFVGVLPGVGQSTASLLSYNQCRTMSKEPEKFGTGCPDGIIASEAANNACCGGALIPMMSLGIPGDMVTAILLGGLTVHGLQPGPLLFRNSSAVVGVVFVAFLLANFVMFFEEIGLMRAFIKLMTIPSHVLYPSLFLMCVIGTYSVNSRIFDSYVLLGVGIVAYLLASNGFPLPPLVLGYILGGLIETNFRTAIISAKGSMAGLFTRPIAMILLAIGFIMLVYTATAPARRKKKEAKKLAKEAGTAEKE